MKLADRVIETHNRGIVAESKFSIQQSSKMFKILSDSLYSDKVQAVIRELSLMLMIVILVLAIRILLR